MTRMKSDRDLSGPSELVADIPSLFRNTGVPLNINCEWEPEHIETSYSKANLLELDIALEAVSERVTAIGTLILQWSAQCRRCLDHTIGETKISINEVFERSASEGETFELPNNEKLDLKPMLTEQVILNLPLTALCSESCSGPSETKFLVSAADDNIGEKKDPRWAILDELQLSDE